jgi:hypothetical protein
VELPRPEDGTVRIAICARQSARARDNTSLIRDDGQSGVQPRQHSQRGSAIHRGVLIWFSSAAAQQQTRCTQALRVNGERLKKNGVAMAPAAQANHAAGPLQSARGRRAQAKRRRQPP